MIARLSAFLVVSFLLSHASSHAMNNGELIPMDSLFIPNNSNVALSDDGLFFRVTVPEFNRYLAAAGVNFIQKEHPKEQMVEIFQENGTEIWEKKQ